MDAREQCGFVMNVDPRTADLLRGRRRVRVLASIDNVGDGDRAPREATGNNSGDSYLDRDESIHMDERSAAISRGCRHLTTGLANKSRVSTAA